MKSVRFLFFVVFVVEMSFVYTDAEEMDEFYTGVMKLSDWGIARVDDIFSGQMAVIEDTKSKVIEFHSLYPEVSSPLFNVRIQDGEKFPPAKRNFTVSFQEGKDVNNLKGRFGAYRRLPSSGELRLENGELSLYYQKEDTGYCGLWVHLFDSSLPQKDREYFDSSSFLQISFTIRGIKKNEKYSLRIADGKWLEKEDAVNIGDISEFLLSGAIDEDWLRVSIPLNRLPSILNKKRLASLVLSIDSPGEGVVAIKDIQFLQTPLLQKKLGNTKNDFLKGIPLKNATWIWNAQSLMTDEKEKEAVVRFLLQKEIGIVFLQLPSPFFQKEIKANDAALQSFQSVVGALRKDGIQVFALDGSPSYGRPENHDSVLRVLSNVVQYNRNALPERRLTGVHYDIEPHALPGFGSVERDRILNDLLSLYEKMMERLQGSQLLLGVDIPFWYDSPDELTGARNDIVFRNVRKNVCQHIIDLTDYVVVMDYRTKADGADGLIENAEGELRYAESVGKSVFIAVETRPISDQALFRIQGVPRRKAPDIFPSQGLFVVRLGDDGDRAFLFPGEESYRKMGKDLESGGDVFFWPVLNGTVVSGSKISFSTLGNKYMESVLSKTKSSLQKYSSFKGFAIHDAANYRLLQ